MTTVYFSNTLEQVHTLNVVLAPSTPQPLCLLVIQVHVPRSAGCDEHPACQHQCLLRPHHPVLQQCFCLRQICCIKLWRESLLDICDYVLQDIHILELKGAVLQNIARTNSCCVRTSCGSLMWPCPLPQTATQLSPVSSSLGFVYFVTNRSAVVFVPEWFLLFCVFSCLEGAVCQTVGSAAQLAEDRLVHVPGTDRML